MRLSSTAIIALVLLHGALTPQTAAAANACSDAFSNEHAAQSAAVRKIVLENGYDQWLRWEQTANVAQFLRSPDPIAIPLVPMEEARFEIQASKHVPQQLKDLFQQGDYVFWPKHPYNMSEKVPLLAEIPSTSIKGYLTASRSIALSGKLRGFTIKLATDHPFGKNGEFQPSKINTNDDIDSALLHTSLIDNVDREIGKDPVFSMMGEVYTLEEKTTGIGMVIRDVRQLEDGNYYLPALSLPFVGREIADANGEKFEPFFKKVFAEALGQAKARMLLRYGLQMLTPNAQNMLIQFDRNLRPTGRIIFRDVSDAYLVEPVARGLGFDKQIKKDIAAEYEPKTEINPYWSNSSWRMDEAGDKSVSSKALTDWGQAHNGAYAEYIEKELGIKFPKDFRKLAPADNLHEIYTTLASAEGQAKLKAYRARLVAERTQAQKAK